MAGTPSRLVLVQHDWPIRIPTGAVQTYVILALRRFAWLVKYFQCDLIRVENIPLLQFLMEHVIDRCQQMFCRPLQPVEHGLS